MFDLSAYALRFLEYLVLMVLFGVPLFGWYGSRRSALADALAGWSLMGVLLAGAVAGLVLTGTEIKSIRQGKVNLKESYAKIDNGEVIVLGMHISPYEQGNRFNVDPLRPRKLLLHKQEIRKLIGYTTLKGLTLVPLTMYINEKGMAKMELAVARGKKEYDKRDTIAKKDADRRMQQVAKNYRKDY